MFYSLLILVFAAKVCDAQVTKLSTSTVEKRITEDVADSLRRRGLTAMEVYCAESSGLVVRCFSLDGEKTYLFSDVKAEFKGQAVGFITIKTECSYDPKKLLGVVVGIALMTTCNDVVDINVENKAIEAELGDSTFEICTDGGCKVVHDGPNLKKTKWKSLPQPKPAAGLSKAQGAKKNSPDSECERAYSCLSCSTGRVCSPTKGGGKLYEVARFDCTDVFPYCNYTSGSCSSSPDAACFDLPQTLETENFLCMRDGYYPDPLSCERFFSCKNKIAYEHFCPYYPTPYYHPGLKLCIPSKEFCTDMTSSHNCVRKENHGRKIPIAFTPNYFIVCGVNNNVLAVDRCVGDYVFDPAALKCVFGCPYEGLFVNDKDCTKYIKCTRQKQGGFVKTDKQCPEGLAFSESEFKCVKRKLVANCRKPIPDLFDK